MNEKKPFKRVLVTGS